MVQRTSETLSDLYLADETAWLETSSALLVHSPMQVRITAKSQRWRKLAGPQACQ